MTNAQLGQPQQRMLALREQTRLLANLDAADRGAGRRIPRQGLQGGMPQAAVGDRIMDDNEGPGLWWWIGLVLIVLLGCATVAVIGGIGAMLGGAK